MKEWIEKLRKQLERVRGMKYVLPDDERRARLQLPLIAEIEQLQAVIEKAKWVNWVWLIDMLKSLNDDYPEVLTYKIVIKSLTELQQAVAELDEEKK